MIDRYLALIALKRLPRTGWLQRGVPDPESIAEHTFGVATLALLLGDLTPDVDRGRVLALALLHDMAEALLTDLPSSATRLIGVETKRAAERAALAELLGGHPNQAEYLGLWEEYTSGATREARLVKALDRLELLAQALTYERSGSRNLDEFWRGAREGWPAEFPALGPLAARLLDSRDVI